MAICRFDKNVTYGRKNPPTHTAKPSRTYSFISSLPREGNINSELARLSLALSSLDTMIQTHVSSHYTDLLR